MTLIEKYNVVQAMEPMITNAEITGIYNKAVTSSHRLVPLGVLIYGREL